MNNILLLVGRSCSGKDTIANELVKLGLHRVITYTTRPIRHGEIDGETYHYISVSDFLKKYIDGDFLEVNYYITNQGIWYYGSSIESYINADENTMCILTPSGLRKLKENNIKYTGFLINVSDETILKRQIERGDDKIEAERRFNSDKRDFEGCENLVDYIINNENRDASEVAREIDELYRKRESNG